MSFDIIKEVVEELLKNSEYCKFQFELGRKHSLEGKKPAKFAGPYFEGYTSEFIAPDCECND